MATWLKQSTAVEIALGPFVDATDGVTPETSLTITQPDIRLKKNGGAWAQKSAAQTLSHEENGWYEASLSTTDTDTLGILVVAVYESGALPVWREFLVVAANVYDSLIGGGDVLDVSLIQWLGSAPNALASSRVDVSVGAMAANVLTAAAINADAITAAKVADGTIDAATFAAGAINAAAIATDAITAGKIAADAIGASELAADAVAEIADQVWDEVLSGHAGVGSTGAALAAAGGSGDPWSTALPGAYGAGTAGALLAQVDNDIAAVQTDTDNIQTRLPAALVSGRIDASVGAMAANTMTAAAAASDLTTELQTGLATTAALATVGGYIDTEVASILADLATVLSRLSSARAGYLDNLSAGAVATQASVNTVDDFLDTEVAAIKTVTDHLATALELDGAVYRYTTNALEQGPGGGAPSAAAVADAVWDEAISGHLGAGTTGAKLNSLSGASGSGAITVVGTITSGGNPVDGAAVWVTTDAAGNSIVASGVTDTLGNVTLFLDAGTYYKWAQRGGVNFSNGEAFVVA